jgi:hypothetical protein
MGKSQIKFDNSGFSKHVLLVLVIVLAIAVGIMGTVLYLQKTAKFVDTAGFANQSLSSMTKQQVDQQVQATANSNEFLSFSGAVKSVNGNIITLANLPNFSDPKNTERELAVNVSERTQIVKFNIDQKQSLADISKAAESPAQLSEIKTNSQLLVELFQAVDFSGSTKNIEAKKISIEFSPGFE